MTSPTETEFKLKSLANLQLKFSPFETPAIILAKLGVLCDLLDISLGPRRQHNIVDDYFDDANLSLWHQRCSFRRRQVDSRNRVTLKVHSESPLAGAVQRLEDEFDCTDAEFAELLERPLDLSKRITETLALSVDLGRMIKLLRIQNRRWSVPLKTAVAEYRFCYDKYYYYDENHGRFSEYFAEIEIEFEGNHLGSDPQLEKLRNALSRLLHYTPSASTKLERGLGWVRRDPPELQTIYTIAFDIVDYTRRTADLQKQMILMLNRIAKESIREIRGAGAEIHVIYIPTGDGMILVFEDHPETIVPIVFLIQRKVKEHIGALPAHEHFAFRTGLHAGPVFKYSDVNENINFAGNGINFGVRAMGLGDEWHILATQEAYEVMGRTSKQFAESFVDIGVFRVKHGQAIHIFNVVGRDWQCGNPSTPRP